MKVALINTTFLNGGDAAINFGTMRILRRTWGENTEFVCYDSQPDAARRLYPGIEIRALVFDRVAAEVRYSLPRKFVLLRLLALAFRMGRRTGYSAGKRGPAVDSGGGFRDRLREYLDADVVVSAGGTYLVDNYRIAPRLFEFLLVLALRRPLVLFTQSIGPLSGRRDRWILGWILRRATLVMVRDGRSRREILALGMPPRRLAKCPDAAFALAGGPAGRRPVRKSGNPPRIAISVRDWPFFGGHAEDGMERYLDAVAGFVRRVVDIDGAKVTLLSSCQGVREYWTDDSTTAARVLRRLPSHVTPNVVIDGSFLPPDGLISRLRSFDCVVATRMHMAILALCAGRPVIPIAYEFKTRELFDGLDFDVPVHDIETVRSDDLYAAWRAVERSSAMPEATAAGWSRVERAHEDALDSGALVSAALAGRIPA